MSELVLRTETDERGIATVTMNRPDIRNAFNETMIAALTNTISMLSGDHAVRVIVITGEGKAFSAGADLSMMRRVAGYAAEENKQEALRLAAMLESIYFAKKPTIALVNGPAIGGGLGLVAACDIAVAAETAFFALSEVRLGLIPAVISPFVIEAIGVRQARRYFLTGERFDAMRAREIGLVHKVAIPANLGRALNETLDDLLAGGPIAQEEAKALIRAAAFRAVDDTMRDTTAAWIAAVRASDEGRDGMGAFLEKRRPSWKDSGL